MAIASQSPGDDDIVIALGVDLDPATKDLNAAKPKLESQSQRIGEAMALQIARGIENKLPAINSTAAKIGEALRRIDERRKLKADPIAAEFARSFREVERQAKAHENRMLRQREQFVRQYTSLQATRRIEQMQAVGMGVNTLSSILPRYAGAGMGMGSSIGGKFGGPEGAIAGAAIGAGVGVIGDVASLAGRGVKYAYDQVPEASKVEQAGMKFRQVFGTFSETVESEVDDFAASVKMSRYQLRSFAADTGGMLQAMGLADGEVAKMSAGISKLAVDLASFHNISEGDAMTKLMAGLSGEMEPLRRLGPNLTEANVAAKALEMGLAKTAKEITQVDKVQARYQLILEGTARAQGDAARSIDTYEASRRRLDAAWSEFNIKLGETMLPVAMKLNDVMAELARQFTLSSAEATVLGEMIRAAFDNIKQSAGVGSKLAGWGLSAYDKMTERDPGIVSQLYRAGRHATKGAYDDFNNAAASERGLAGMARRDQARRQAEAGLYRDTEPEWKTFADKRFALERMQSIYDAMPDKTTDSAKAMQGAIERLTSEFERASKALEAAKDRIRLTNELIAKDNEDMLKSRERAGELLEKVFGKRFKPPPRPTYTAEELRDKDASGKDKRDAALIRHRQAKVQAWDEAYGAADSPGGSSLTVARGRTSRMAKANEASSKSDVENAAFGVGKWLASNAATAKMATQLLKNLTKGVTPKRKEESILGGNYFTSESYAKSIQSAIFQSAEAAKERAAAEAAKKTAAETEKTKEAVHAATAALKSGFDMVTNTLKGAMGYGK